MRLLILIITMVTSVSAFCQSRDLRGCTDKAVIDSLIKEEKKIAKQKRHFFDIEDGYQIWRWKYNVKIDTLELISDTLDVLGNRHTTDFSPYSESRSYNILRIDSIDGNIVVFKFNSDEDIGELLTDNRYKFSLGEVYGYMVYNSVPTLVIGNSAHLFFKKAGQIDMSPIYVPRVESSLEVTFVIVDNYGFYLQRNGKFEFIDTGEDKNSGIQERSYLEYIRRNLPKDE